MRVSHRKWLKYCEARVFPVSVELVVRVFGRTSVTRQSELRTDVRCENRLSELLDRRAYPPLNRQFVVSCCRSTGVLTPWYGADQRRRVLLRRRRVVTGVVVAIDAPTRGRTGRLQPSYVIDDANRRTSSTSSTSLTRTTCWIAVRCRCCRCLFRHCRRACCRLCPCCGCMCVCLVSFIYSSWGLPYRITLYSLL